jgi:outer membrane immunogenic protein
MRRLLLAHASVAALVAATPALAAAPPPSFNWTGCYIGLHEGGGWGRSGFSDAPNGVLVDFNSGGTINDNTSGWLGGGQAGCDVQALNNWVFGFEGQFAGANISGTASNPFIAVAGFGDPFYAKTEWLANVTGRAGYTWDRVLVYAKAGVGWAGNKYSAPDRFYGGAYTASETRSGWALGGGVEWAFANGWSAKAEYLHYGLGDAALGFMNPGAFILTSPTNVNLRVDTVTVGVSWHFNAGTTR